MGGEFDALVFPARIKVGSIVFVTSGALEGQRGTVVAALGAER